MANEWEAGLLKLESRLRIAAWVVGGALLLLPLVAMEFTSEVDWTTFDFIVAGVLIGGTGLVYELAARRTRGIFYRAGVAAALVASFLLIWINGAVGVIGSEDEAANMLYIGVIAIALLGSLLVGFRRRGMAWVMTAAAAAQALVPIAAWLLALAPVELLLRREVPGSTVIFTAIWLFAALMFRHAVRQAEDAS